MMKKAAMPSTPPRNSQSPGVLQYLNKSARTATGPMLRRAATVGRHAQRIAVPRNSHAHTGYQLLGAPSDRPEIRIEPAIVKYAAEAIRHSVGYFIRRHPRVAPKRRRWLAERAVVPFPKGELVLAVLRHWRGDYRQSSRACSCGPYTYTRQVRRAM